MFASCLSGIPLLNLHIMAQHIIGRITEHFPNVFFGNPVGLSDCHSKRIAGYLGGQTLGNSTPRRHLFKVFTHFLDWRERKTRTSRIHRIPASVFLQQDHCQFKKRNTACTAVSDLRSFSTCPANPYFVIPKQVRRTKSTYPLIGKSGERTEYEHILHPFQTSGRHIRFHHCFQFIPAQEGRGSLLFHA